MGSKGHFFISVIKSSIRIASCLVSIRFNDFVILAVGLAVAESLGIAEELVDKR